MDADRIGRTLTRIAHEIVERNKGVEDLALVGVRTRGVHIARRLARALREITGQDIPTGALDITLYRDDLDFKPPRPLEDTSIPEGGIDGTLVVLVDDVLYTGRSVRSALDALRDIGRPRAVQLAVLVDRGHRELPIRADFVGKNVPTGRADDVRVLVAELDGEDAVVVEGAR
jgi:pyrimidine operon attenuation protein/uracil phosphoribosyltransferase